MKRFTMILAIILLTVIIAKSQPTSLDLLTPKAGDPAYKVGRTYSLTWDTTKGTNGSTLEFFYGEGPSGPWTPLLLPGLVNTFKDVNAKVPTTAAGTVKFVAPSINSANVYFKMRLQGNDNVADVNGPCTISIPSATHIDSTIDKNISSTITLSNRKVYGLSAVIFVKSGATLRIEPGTVIVGIPGQGSALCIDRGAKIYAKGYPSSPIIMTSGAVPGERAPGDWGGLLILGKAPMNHGTAAIEGGIATATEAGEDGWYGGTDEHDSSGVLEFVRVEYGGFAVSPDNELNGVTLGAVGDKTVIDHVQSTYAGDDSYEFFGGTVNAKYMIAYGTLDDSYDTDNGYSGKIQFALDKRFPTIADISNSEMFESDNDASSTFQTPFTKVLFSNFTGIGGVGDISWDKGLGDNQWNPFFLTAVQVRRNSRLSLWNSVITGWPRGVEMTNQNTVQAANHDSLGIRFNSFYSIKDTSKNFYFGSGAATTAEGKVDANWLATPAYGNEFNNATGNAGDNAFLTTVQFPQTGVGTDFDPSPKANAPYLTTANFDAAGVIPINDPFFKKVPYRGAFAPGERWDLPWAEYDPNNAQYDKVTAKLLSPVPPAKLRVGRSFPLNWDTRGTLGKTLKFAWSTSQNGPWTTFPLGSSRASSILDSNAKTGFPLGTINTTVPTLSATTDIYIKMAQVSDTTFNDVEGPITVSLPAPSHVDSLLNDPVISTITLSNKKVYGVNAVIFVKNNATLRIEPGTIILGIPGKGGAICIDRGAKIYAKGTPDLPIIMSSAAAPGERAAGDWGGLLILGKAPMNHGTAAIEGGIATATEAGEDGWYGGSDAGDSSGVVEFTRVEFGGFAISPDNELNGFTFGAVGNKTVIDHVQVSYPGDDSYEWFGGTVNCKHMIAYGTLDDSYDTDNGFSGKIQFGLDKRFPSIADISNSEAFESDNDASSTFQEPFTKILFSNMTSIGGVGDILWTKGLGENQWNPFFLTAVQIRRNSRLSLWNSVITGWPRGVEMTNQNTVQAANHDSLGVRFNSFYSIIDASKNFYFGSGAATVAEGNVDANWINTPAYGNDFHNDNGNAGSNAFLTDVQFPADGIGTNFDPTPTANAPYLTTANFDDAGVIPINDPFFTKVAYRGAFGPSERWDLPWAEYDPVHAEYKAQVGAVNDEQVNRLVPSVSVMPQPAYAIATARYRITEPANVTVKLINTTGALEATLINNELQDGVHEININTSSLSSGMYFLEIITNQGTKVVPVVVAH